MNTQEYLQQMNTLVSFAEQKFGKDSPAHLIASWAEHFSKEFVNSIPLPSCSFSKARKQMVEQALIDNNGNRRMAAEALGISERTLYRLIKQ